MKKPKRTSWRWVVGRVGFVLALAVLASGDEAAAQDRPRVWGINPASSLPSNGEAFELGESLDVEVLFSEPVIVRGSPGLVLTVGSETRLATLLPYYLNRPSSTLPFRYLVGRSDRDTDGFSTPANPLRLFGGSIKAAADGATDADLTHGGFADGPFRKVDGTRVTVPMIRTVSLSGLRVPGVPETVLRGETIRLEVEFSRAVAVSGSPQLALDIGGVTRLARHYPEYLYPRSLFFRYTVQDTDRDIDGIVIPDNALRLNGGTIEAAVDGSIDARLSHTAVIPRPSLNVDGSRSDVPTPEVALVGFTHFDPVVLERGEELGVQVVFTSEVFVSGNPRLTLAVGSHTRLATCSGVVLLRCRYRVQAADRDIDGVSIPANALRLDGAKIVSGSDGVTNAVLTHAAVEADGIPMVDGSLAMAPRVEHVFFNDELDYREDGDTYRLGQSIQLLVRLDRPVEVTGTPVLELTVGDRQRLAACSGTYNILVCRYRVQAADRDIDGVSVPVNALRLNNGTIAKLSDGGVTPALLSHGSVIGGPSRKVDGSRVGTVTTGVRDISIPPAANGHTFEFGEIVEVRVGFEKPVAVTGRPQLALTVGTRTRWATCAASGLGLKCLYAVQVADRDADGISVPADALRLDGATIKARPDGLANAALEHLPVVDQSSARVDGGRVTSLATSLHLLYPWDVTAYQRGETIWVGLRVGRDVRLGRGGRGVVVTGNPRVAMRVGDRERLATYSAKGPSRLLPASLQSDAAKVIWFGYVVRAEDRDTNGVSIRANAVRLDGGAVRLAVDGLTEPPLTHAAVGASFLRKVDGVRFSRPLVGRIAVTGLPRNGDNYGLGEAIRLSVRFTRPVAVSGTPQVLLTIGDQTGVASYAEGLSSARTHIFEYAVQPNDRDADGISIPANALRLNGGRITLADGVTDADLTHAAIADDIVRKVDAGVITVPAINAVSLRGSPVSGDTYASGETIEVAVRFTGAVAVTGHPQVELAIGERTRYAAYVPDLRNRQTLYFRYIVQPTDLDSDGISIPANALRLNGATIRLADGATDALLIHPAVVDDPRRKVRGGDAGGGACRGLPPTSSPDRPSSGPPVAAFALEASCAGEAFAVRAGVEVVLRDMSRGTVKTRHWDFGDGAASSVQHPRHVWVVPGFYRVSLTVSDGETSSSAFHDVLVEASAPAGPCRPDAETRCLQDSRYEVRVLWWTTGGSGRARVAHAGTNETGLFWFFDPDNWEILVKVLDGCSANGHFWVFGAATTDLGLRFTVTDTVTGRARVYQHEPGEPAAAITDSSAFADGCRR